MDDFGQTQQFETSLDQSPGLPTRPCNIEAEQSLLGSILSNNDVFSEVSKIIESKHFFDPIHQLLFQLIKERIDRRSTADPRTLKPFVAVEPGFADLGGVGYLVKLQDAAIGIHACHNYAREIYQLSVRRRLIDLYAELTETTKNPRVDKSVSELISEAEQRIYEIGEHGEGDIGFKSLISSMSEAVAVARRAFERDGGLAGLATGFTDLDQKLGGLQDSDLVIIAGRPGMGKTALATNIAFNLARRYRKDSDDNQSGGIVGFFSLEMPAVQLVARILATVSRIPVARLRTGKLDQVDLDRYIDAARDLQACPLYIDETAAMPIAQLATRARRQKETKGLDLLIVDYIQLVQASSSSNEGRVHQIAEITQGLKAIAKELKIPVIALSQLSRGVESRDDNWPQLSDLRDSGAIEQDADVVLFVYRKQYYLEQKKPDEDDSAAIEKWKARMEDVQGRAEIIIAKHRQGPTGTVKMSFDSDFTAFGNAAPSGYKDPSSEGRP